MIETLDSEDANSKMDNSTSPVPHEELLKVVALGIGLGSLSVITLLGNAMVLHAIRTEKRLQTVSHMFIMSLALADLIVGLVVMPISSAYVLLGRWTFGRAVCQFWLSVDYTASTASILNLLILGMDRFWSIRSPLQYMRKRTRQRALVMIGLAWLIAATWIIPIIGWQRLHGVHQHPPGVCETDFSSNALFKLVASLANFYIPMLLMVSLYLKIFQAIRQRSSFGTSSPSPTPTLPDPPQSENSVPRLRLTNKRSLASTLRQEKKAARQLGVIMSAFLLCWLPYTVVFTVDAYCLDCVSARVHLAAVWLGYTNSTLNPFLYALCNATFKQAFKKLVFRRQNSVRKSENLFT